MEEKQIVPTEQVHAHNPDQLVPDTSAQAGEAVDGIPLHEQSAPLDEAALVERAVRRDLVRRYGSSDLEAVKRGRQAVRANRWQADLYRRSPLQS